MKINILFGLIFLCFSCVNRPDGFGGETDESSIKPYFLFSRDSVLLREGVFKDDRLYGKWISYHENGELKKIEHYLKSELHGDYLAYNDSGQCIEKGSYLEGRKEGEWMISTDNGCLKTVENYKQGLLDGAFEAFDDVENLIEKGVYSEGLKTEKWAYFYSNGDLAKEEYYERDSVLWYKEYILLDPRKDSEKKYIVKVISSPGRVQDFSAKAVVFNARLDGELWLSKKKIADLKRGEELELLMTPGHYVYSFRYPKDTVPIHRLDMQVDSFQVQYTCKEYLLLEEDTLLNALIQQNRINQFKSYLDNPVEANYDYDWIKHRDQRFIERNGFDPKVDSVLSLVYLKRKEVIKKEIEEHLSNVEQSTFNDIWLYEAVKWEDRELDSLALLAYYIDQGNVFEVDTYLVNRITPFLNRQDKKFTKLQEVTCLSPDSAGTIISNIPWECRDQIFSESPGYGIDLELRVRLLDSGGYKIKDKDFTLYYSNAEGCGSYDDGVLVLRTDERNVFIRILKDYGSSSGSYHFETRMHSDGQIELFVNHLKNRMTIELANGKSLYFRYDYRVFVDYVLNDEFEVEFRGVRIPRNDIYGFNSE